MPPAPATAQAAKIRARLQELLAPVVRVAGYELEDITVTSAGRRSLIRVIVDADGGVDMDAVATMSRAMSEALDADNAAGPDFADPYVLEVSSPGVDRPLTEPRHWRRAAGRLVEVSVDGKALTGRIVATDDVGVSLEVAGIKGRPAKAQVIAWSALGRGKVQVEFSRRSGDGTKAPGETDDIDDIDDDEFDLADFDGADLFGENDEGEE